MNIRKLFSLLIVICFAFSLFGSTTSVWAQNYNPGIAVDYNQDAVALWNWAIGTQLFLTIDDPDSGVGVDYSDSMFFELDPRAFYLWGEGGYDIQPGDIVTVTDLVTTQQVIATDVRILGANADTDMVYGTADPGDSIEVYAYKTCDFVGSPVIVDPNGSWSKDFTNICDLTGTTTIMAVEHESGATRFFFDMPTFTFYPQNNTIDCWTWQVDNNVTLTIDNLSNGIGVDYTNTMSTPPLSWNPYGSYINFDLGTFETFPGDIMTLTDGITTKTEIVPNFTLNGGSIADDTVWGTAVPGTIVQVEYETDPNALRNVITDGSGNWMADFSIPGDEPGEEILFDIQPGNVMLAKQKDPDGDLTQLNWQGQSPENQPPLITSIIAPLTPIKLGTSIDATVIFSDPDVGDSHTVTWDWGDNSSTTAPAAVPTVTNSYTYTSPGVYRIDATITDSAGETSTAAIEYVVIFDPVGGFVTGGGWIMSPAGAYRADPTLQGKATFGFQSKYKKGQNIPDGNTQFQFSAGDLSFHSTSYEWLIVNQNYSNAQFKEYGTINGEGNYGFMIWAGDGSPDTFRINIWDPSTEDVIYDNGVQQPIGGGSIVIHN